MHTVVLMMYLNNVLSCTHIFCRYNGENEVGPDSRHVPLSYIIHSYNILSVIKNKCSFSEEKKRTVFPDPSPSVKYRQSAHIVSHYSCRSLKMCRPTKMFPLNVLLLTFYRRRNVYVLHRCSLPMYFGKRKQNTSI